MTSTEKVVDKLKEEILIIDRWNNYKNSGETVSHETVVKYLDDLNYEKPLKILQGKIMDGLESGISEKSFDEIINEARLKIKEKPSE